MLGRDRRRRRRNDARQEALVTPFVTDFASFLYTTPSHTNNRHRFRIVFLLNETIHKSDQWKNCLLRARPEVGGACDQGRWTNVFWQHRSGPPDRKAASEKGSGRSHRSGRRSPLEVEKQARPVGPDGVFAADRRRSTRQDGDGDLIRFKDLPVKTSVCCPFHIDNRRQRLRGQVIQGIHGHSLHGVQRHLWASDPESYDFDAFDRLVEERRGIDRESTPRT